jgi:hypothetical protein
LCADNKFRTNRYAAGMGERLLPSIALIAALGGGWTA